MKPSLCKACAAKEAAPSKQCDYCPRVGCPHFISPNKAEPDRDCCGGCRFKLARAAKKPKADA
jgi:hypothetical protein